MASTEFVEMMRAAAERPAPPADETLEQQRRRIDEAMSRIPLAAGIEAVESHWRGVSGLRCSPTDLDVTRTIVYFHGGGFRIGSSIAYRSFASHLARACSAHVIVPDYRLAPENPYPAALDDSLAVFDAVVESGTPASRIVVAGDSAGGGLAASVALRRISTDRAPAGVACFSPWADLRIVASTYETNAERDLLFSRRSAETARSMYLGSTDPSDPSVSPVLGDWRGAPPCLVLAGGAEVLLGDALTLGGAMAMAGVDVDLHVFADMPHIWIMSHPAFPEAVRAVDLFAAFCRRVSPDE